MSETILPNSIESVLATVMENYHSIISEHWIYKPLGETCEFRFDTDGLREPMVTSGNFYAALCLNLRGALSWDWGWGFFEVIDSCKHGFFIQQNGLTFLPETFNFLDGNFGTTTPDIPDNVLERPGNMLFELLLEHLASDVRVLSTDTGAKEWLNNERNTSLFTDTLVPRVTELLRALMPANKPKHRKGGEAEVLTAVQSLNLRLTSIPVDDLAQREIDHICAALITIPGVTGISAEKDLVLTVNPTGDNDHEVREFIQEVRRKARAILGDCDTLG